MSQTKQPAKPVGKVAANQNRDKVKAAAVASGGKPSEPMLKPHRQSLPMKK